MRYLKLFFFLFLIVACKNGRTDAEVIVNNGDSLDVITEFGIPVSEFDVREGTIRRGQFFTNLLTDLGAENADIYALTQAARTVFDLKKI